MNKKITITLLKTLFKSIGIILFIVIIYKVGINRIVEAFTTVSSITFLIIVCLLIVVNILKALRWKIICHGYGYEIDYAFAIKTYIIGTFLGFLTPGKVGDFGKSYYLYEKNIPLKKGLMTVVIDRAYDLFFLFIFVIVSIIYLQLKFDVFRFNIDNGLLLIYGIFGLNAAGLIIFLFNEIDIPLFIQVRKNINHIYDNFIRLSFTTKDYLAVTGLTICALIIGYALFYYLAYNLGIPIGFIDIMACAFVISFLQLIPITVLGIGTRDITLIYFFKLNDIGPEWAVTLSMTVLLANILAVTPGMFLFMKNKYSK